jgi:signal transduction histidine kinase
MRVVLTILVLLLLAVNAVSSDATKGLVEQQVDDAEVATIKHAETLTDQSNELRELVSCLRLRAVQTLGIYSCLTISCCTTSIITMMTTTGRVKARERVV